VVAIVGATASGKSALAMELAAGLDCEIVSVDSMQVYRGMDVGTAKPSAGDRSRVPHHMLDLVTPDEGYSAGRYAREADAVLASMAQRQRLPLLVGGTGLYLRALLHGMADLGAADPGFRMALRARETAHPGAAYDELQALDPASAEGIAASDFVRIERALEIYQATGRPRSELLREHAGGRERYAALVFELRPERAWLEPRVRARTAAMWRAGLLDECEALRRAGYGPCRPMRAIGYKEAGQHLDGLLTREEAMESQIRATLRFAKRQRNWFRAEPLARALDPSAVDRQRLRDRIRHFLDALDGPSDPG
jgi:tRNA dimethylallyltransferase